ncbi:MAG: DUF3592 domain-containing protein, partial [Mycobacteriales bacterium]
MNAPVRSRLTRGLVRAMTCGSVLVVVGLLVGLRPVGDQRARHHLTRSATGTVTSVAALHDVYSRLTVTWTDLRGAPHTSRFDTDTDNWSVGDELDVRYDPAHRTPARPDDEYYTNDSALRVTALAQGAVPLAAGLLLVLIPLLRPRRAEAHGCDPALTWPLLRAARAPAQVGADRPASAAPLYWHPENADVRRRRGWDRYGRTAKRLLLASVVTAAAATILISVVAHRDTQLLRDGLRTTGTVEGGGYGGRNSQGYVEVRYTDASGGVHDGTLHGSNPDQLPRGSRVTVIYDKGEPGRFRTPDDVNNGNLLDTAMVVLPTASLMLALTGALTFRRWRRGLRVLAVGRWLHVDVARVRPFPRRSSVLLSLDAGPDRDPVVVRFTGSRQGVADTLALRQTRQVSVCATPTR